MSEPHIIGFHIPSSYTASGRLREGSIQDWANKAPNDLYVPSRYPFIRLSVCLWKDHTVNHGFALECTTGLSSTCHAITNLDLKCCSITPRNFPSFSTKKTWLVRTCPVVDWLQCCTSVSCESCLELRLGIAKCLGRTCLGTAMAVVS